MFAQRYAASFAYQFVSKRVGRTRGKEREREMFAAKTRNSCEITKNEETKGWSRIWGVESYGKSCIVVTCQKRESKVQSAWRGKEGRRRRKKKKGCVDLDAREKHHLSLTLCVSSLPLKAFLVLSRTVSFRIG